MQSFSIDIYEFLKILPCDGSLLSKCNITLNASSYCTRGPGSIVGIASGYGLDGPGIESLGGEIFRTYLDWPWGPHSLLYIGYQTFLGVKSGRGVTLTPHPLLMPWS